MQTQTLAAYYRNVPPADLSQRSDGDRIGAAQAHYDLANRWGRGHHALRIYNPTPEEHGWRSPHTIVEIVTRDRPFLIDSLTMVLNQHGFAQHLVVHPILWVHRGAGAEILTIAEMSDERRDAGRAEAWIHIEIDQERDSHRLQRLRADLERSLTDVRAAVADWPAMTARVEREAVGLGAAAIGVPKAVVEESAAFLRWLLDNNFTLLGVREYRLVEVDGAPQLQALPGSGLGILRHRGGRAHLSRSFAETPIDLRVHARPGQVLTLTKSNSRSTVHRPDYLDYVGIKRYHDDGRVAGELRVLGLYTSSAHLSRPRSIPIVRDRIAAVIREANLAPRSHDGKALAHILDTYPRQELFEAGIRELATTAIGILHLQERQRIRLFVRPDAFGRYFACQIFIPRDLFDTARRRRIEQILLDALDGEQLEFTLKLSEAPLAHLYVVVHTRRRGKRRIAALPIEQRIAAAVRSWNSDLRQALIAAHGEETGLDYFQRYADVFGTAYCEEHDAAVAVTDIAYIDAALAEQRIQTHIESTGAHGDDEFIFKLFSPGGFVELSAILPILENMGVSVRLQRPFRVTLAPDREVWIHDHECRVQGGVPPVTAALQAVFEEAIGAAWYGTIDNDGLNALVLRQGLAAREIAVLRAYARYVKQIGTPYGLDYLIETLVRNGAIARALFELFDARFKPDRRGAARREEQLRQEIESRLETVSSLDEDRILRLVYRLITATCRTNHFQRDEHGASKPYLSFKLRPEALPELPRPRPAFEIFVCSPRVEGVHLRGGPVARGGLRWSDRREDYRTEVLGLMKAQTVKNAVIVPVGAKGGFFVKRPPADSRARFDEGVACYRMFIHGLLDLTDNLRDGRIVPPAATVRHDGDDPYLVVAADKGTASFSDTANAIAAEYGFWLDDAFASGGSSGYDHKKMGITARGAWESVRHAFQLLDRDIGREDFTVVGIGDMAGDVFGNGMLQSRRIRLLAAFNHQHIFIDPDPDAAASYAERQRLFRLPGSTWNDYDRAAISRGGGVFPRAQKSLRLSPQARAALGTDLETVTPEELIRIVLNAPVDLLWNGGIGTYVKARQQRHEDIGDKTNDRLRVDAEDLRCKVVGEGGNLGFSQAARIRFARRGGLINADWIDNSAGVDCSDHEVNIKILLQHAIARGALDPASRNRLLRAMQPEVARHVIRDNYHQARAISHAQRQSEKYLDWYRHAINRLQETLKLDRNLEQLPADAVLPRRAERGIGLYRPELAALLAHAKIAHCREVIATTIPDDPYLEPLLFSYFPEAIRERFADDVRAHPLRREIITTLLVNELVNRMGITFCDRLSVETGRDTPAIIRAYLAARGCIDVARVWQAIDALDFRVAFASQSELVLTVRRVVERATRWLLAQDAVSGSIDDAVHRFKPHCDQFRARFPLATRTRQVAQLETTRLVAAGVPRTLARDVARLDHLDRAFEFACLAAGSGKAFAEVAACAVASDEYLHLSLLRDIARGLSSADVWQDRARSELIVTINEFHTQVAQSALKAGGFRLWLAQYEERAQRMRSITAQLDPNRDPNLPQLLVLVSQLRALAQQLTE